MMSNFMKHAVFIYKKEQTYIHFSCFQSNYRCTFLRCICWTTGCIILCVCTMEKYVNYYCVSRLVGFSVVNETLRMYVSVWCSLHMRLTNVAGFWWTFCSLLSVLGIHQSWFFFHFLTMKWQIICLRYVCCVFYVSFTQSFSQWRYDLLLTLSMHYILRLALWFRMFFRTAQLRGMGDWSQAIKFWKYGHHSFIFRHLYAVLHCCSVVFLFCRLLYSSKQKRIWRLDGDVRFKWNYGSVGYGKQYSLAWSCVVEIGWSCLEKGIRFWGWRSKEKIEAEKDTEGAGWRMDC